MVTRERKDRDIDSSMSEMLAWKGMGFNVVFELLMLAGVLAYARC